MKRTLFVVAAILAIAACAFCLTQHLDVTLHEPSGVHVGNMSESVTTSPAVAVQAVTTPVLVKTCVNGNETSTANLSTPSCVNSAGNYLIVTATAVRPADTLTVTDTVGDAFTLVSSAIDGSCYPFVDTIQTGGGEVYLFYVASAKGGSPNVFTNTSTHGGSALEIHVSEWSGMSGWTPDRCGTANGATGGTSFSSPSRTTQFNGELIFGYTFPLGNSTPGTGFTGLSFVNGDWDEYKIQPTAGAVAATFTSDNNGTWLATIATFASPQ